MYFFIQLRSKKHPKRIPTIRQSAPDNGFLGMPGAELGAFETQPRKLHKDGTLISHT